MVDEKQGLIVDTEAVSDPNDSRQFNRQLDNAKEELGRIPQTACADAGYANTAELQKVEQTQVQPMVPSQTQASHQKPREFHHNDFKYDSQKDCYVCPEGKTLVCVGSEKAGISKNAS